ncbi:MAG TPA: hypothetical protein VGR20_17960 [Acidimicrobiia bacterium]|nr:hypothetical protein [Acidimicrobiia bacterium]
MRRDHRGVYRIMATVALAATAFGGAAVPAGATPGQDQTWVGQVEKHGRHYDYVGRSCPVESTEPCPDYEVRYQIVPSSAQAARALPKVAGHRARLIGHRELVREPGHNGTLVVTEVQSRRAPGDPVESPPRGYGGVPRK